MNQSISVLSTSIRVHEGLYSLNDLHRASGGEEKHRPTFFLRTDQTKALIEEIECCADMHITPVQAIKGNRSDGTPQGTYACKELVYAYAMWISPRFHLHVIRAFDAMVTGNQAQPALPPPLTPSNRLKLRRAIERKARGDRSAYSRIYRELHDTFQVSSYRDIPDAEFTSAMVLVKSVTIEGQIVPRETAQADEFILPPSQRQEIIRMLDHLHSLFHPFSEYATDVLGVKRALQGLHPRLGIRQAGYVRLIESSR